MPTVYEKCPKEVYAILGSMMKKFHTPLVEAEIKIQCLFANAGKDKKGVPKPAVKRSGVACAAKVKIVSLKDRAAGNADAEIIIDENVWESLSEDEQAALIDHELEHLIVRREDDKDNGAILTDDLGRPKLKMKKHDWEVWGFKSIVERHGRASLDWQAAQEFKEEFGQLLMFAEDPATVG